MKCAAASDVRSSRRLVTDRPRQVLQVDVGGPVAEVEIDTVIDRVGRQQVQVRDVGAHPDTHVVLALESCDDGCDQAGVECSSEKEGAPRKLLHRSPARRGRVVGEDSSDPDAVEDAK